MGKSQFLFFLSKLMEDLFFDISNYEFSYKKNLFFPIELSNLSNSVWTCWFIWWLVVVWGWTCMHATYVYNINHEKRDNYYADAFPETYFFTF